MDFNAYLARSAESTTTASKGQERSTTTVNFDHFIDPYIRRYHIIKIGVNSATWAMTAYTAKLIIENL